MTAVIRSLCAAVILSPFLAAQLDRAVVTHRFTELPRQAMERTPLPCEMSDRVLLLDADGDGDSDLLFGGMAGTTVLPGPVPGPAPFLFGNDGHGRLAIRPGAVPPGPLGASSFDSRAGDIDGDGDLDVAYAVNSNYPTTTSWILINDGRGNFTDELAARVPQPLMFWSVDAVALLDVDADGDLDMCVSRVGYPYSFLVFANDGTGHFADVSAAKAPPVQGYPTLGQLHVLDLEGDGDLDLLSNARGGFALHVFVNDGTGRFTDEGMLRIRPAMPSAFYTKLALGDVDGDDDIDFAGGRSAVTQQPDLFLNDGNGFFDDASARIPRATLFPQAISLDDLDEDGDLDLLIAGSSIAAIPGIGGEFVFVNDGTGHFTDGSQEFFAQVPNGVVYDHAVGDLDGDGDLDVIVPEIGSGPVRQCRTRNYVNLTRQLYASSPPVLGTPWALDVYGPAFGHAALAISPRPATVPLGTLGTLGLDPTTTIVWPALVRLDQYRHGSVQVPVPSTLPLGVTIYTQALVVDLAAPSLARLTNVWDDAVH